VVFEGYLNEHGLNVLVLEMGSYQGGRGDECYGTRNQGGRIILETAEDWDGLRFW